MQLWDRVLDQKPAAAEGDWGTVAAAVLLIAAQQGGWRVLPQSPGPCTVASPVLANRVGWGPWMKPPVAQGSWSFCGAQLCGVRSLAAVQMCALSISLAEGGWGGGQTSSLHCGLVHFQCASGLCLTCRAAAAPACSHTSIKLLSVQTPHSCLQARDSWRIHCPCWCRRSCAGQHSHPPGLKSTPHLCLQARPAGDVAAQVVNRSSISPHGNRFRVVSDPCLQARPLTSSPAPCWCSRSRGRMPPKCGSWSCRSAAPCRATRGPSQRCAYCTSIWSGWAATSR